MPTALSPHNPRLERVRDLRAPRGRREQGRFAFEGPTLLAEARSSGLTLEELYVTPAALAAHAGPVAELERAGTAVFEIPERSLARLSDLETPPGLLAVARTPAHDATAILGRPGTVLLLAGVGDPGNAGTLLRSAEAFGAAGVLFGRGSVDPFAPKVVRGAMGALFRLPVAHVDAAELLEAAAATGRPIVAATLEGEPLATTALPAAAILAVGNERHGVSAFLPRWDLAVRIEQASVTESLNAAVAGGILLYTAALQRAENNVLSRLGGAYPQGLYSAQISRTPLDRERNRRPMRTSELFWKLFATTGSINAYLVYRRLNPSASNAG